MYWWFLQVYKGPNKERQGATSKTRIAPPRLSPDFVTKIVHQQARVDYLTRSLKLSLSLKKKLYSYRYI